MENSISSRIQARLRELGITATHAALKAGLGKTAVRDIIAGKSKSPTIGTLSKLAIALECSVNYLTGGQKGDVHTNVAEISGSLVAGTFIDKNRTDAANRGERIDAAYFEFGDRNFWLYRMGDDSMTGIGILKNDILSVLNRDEEYIDLRIGMLLVVERRLIGRENIQELSVREVAVRDDMIHLETRPSTGDEPAIVLQRQITSMPTVFPNAYATEEGDIVHIQGQVVRVTRDLRR